MKNRLFFVALALVMLVNTTISAQSPFAPNRIDLQKNSDGTALTSVNSTPQNSAELKKALELLAQTQAKFAELLRQIAANPAKFMKNGSLQEIMQRITSIKDRLNAAAKKLLNIYDNTAGGTRPPLPTGVRTPVAVPPSTGNTTRVAGNAPAPVAMNMPGKVTSKSPGFNGWLANGVNIAAKWNFPDVTNMYGEKVSREHFLKAIMYIESSGVHQRTNGSIVTSSCGALGFMQLMPRTAQGLGVNPRDPAQNIAGGAKYFNTVFNGGKVGKKTGVDKLIMAGCAYNCGPYSKRLDQSWSSFVKDTKAPKETRRYGLKLKMCLGIKLTAEEESVARSIKMTGNKSIEQYARNCYAQSKGIGK